MVGYPYTKYMVSVMDVDMAAALVVATHERADALGVPADRRVYLRGCCYATDPVLVAAHPEMWRSPAMKAAAGDRVRAAGIGIDDVALPRPLLVLRQLAALRLRRARHRRPAIPAASRSPADCRTTAVRAAGTSTHSIAKMADVLRADPGAFGAGQRGRDAHDEARVRRLLHDARRARARPTPPRSSVTSTRTRRCRWCRSTRATRRSPPTRWCTAATDRPSRRCSSATSAAAPARTRASTDADACRAAEEQELVGRTVELAPHTVTGPAGEVRVNAANVA